MKGSDLTTIKLKRGTRLKLKKLKTYQRQSYDCLIKAIIKGVEEIEDEHKRNTY